MTNIGVINFNSGEVSPELDARKDIEKYTGGCRTLENMIPDVFGNAAKRPGTEFIALSQAVDIFSNFYIGLRVDASGINIINKFISSDGELDADWGTDGGWGAEFASSLGRCRDVRFLPDGGVILCYTDRPVGVLGHTVKLDSVGIIDTSFGSSGYVVGGERAIVVDDSDGSLFVAQTVPAGVGGAVITKYDSSGTLVTAFGVNGSLIYPVGSGNRQVALTTNDMKIRDGTLYICSDTSFTQLIPGNWFNITAHDTTTGDLDATWGVDGFSPSINNGNSQSASTINFDSTGRMYVHVIDFADTGSLYRLDADGILDGNFIIKQNDGNVSIPASWNFASGKDTIIDKDGNIWALYSIQNTSTRRLKKYDPDTTELVSIEWTAASVTAPRCIIEDEFDYVIYVGSGNNLGGFGSNLLRYSRAGVRDESFSLVTGQIISQIFPTGELRD